MQLAQQIRSMDHGDHVCLIYQSFAEQVAAAAPFIRTGIERGERCVYVCDDRTATEVADALRDSDIDVDKEISRGTLHLLTKREAYLVAGSFSPASMIEMLRALEAAAVAEGLAGLRITGEMTWALGPERGCDDIMEYEALLNRYFPGSQALAICQYNRERFPARIIEQVLQTHPIAVIGNHVTSNFFYEPPDVFLQPAEDDVRVQWKIDRLQRAHEAEERIVESEAFTRRLLESSGDCVKVLDLSGRLLSINRAGQEMLAIDDPETFVGTDWVAFWNGADRPAARDAVAAAAAGGEGRFQGFCPTIRGEPKWWDVLITSVPDADGAPFRLLSISRDITQQRNAQNELRAAKEKAEAGNQAKSQFLAVMSHELRTPLTGIIGYTDLLASGIWGELSADQCAQLARIKAGAWYLVTIIDDILNFARVDAGKERVVVEDVDFATIVRESAELLAPQCAAAGIDLRVLGSDRHVPVRSDPGKIRQIVLNLTGNAVKFTDQGSVELSLEVEPGGVVLHVRDTGPGIPRDMADRVFEPFTQVDQSATRAKGGTGLGLTVSRNLAQLLGGDITLTHTALGHGSTFTLRLPRQSPAAPGAAAIATQAPA